VARGSFGSCCFEAKPLAAAGVQPQAHGEPRAAASPRLLMREQGGSRDFVVHKHARAHTYRAFGIREETVKAMVLHRDTKATSPKTSSATCTWPIDSAVEQGVLELHARIKDLESG